MAVPSLWPWAACLLAILLSPGFGLDTLEGESPPTPALSPGAPSPPPPSQPGGQRLSSPRTQPFSSRNTTQRLGEASAGPPRRTTSPPHEGGEKGLETAATRSPPFPLVKRGSQQSPV